MPYPENFVVRLLICVVGMYAIWFGVQFILDVVVFHDEFKVNAIDIIVPLAVGVIEAFVWKPKEKK
jgi:hypothetical protein